MSVGLIKKNSGRCPTNFDREDWRRTMHRKKALAAALTAALVSLAAGVDAKEFKYSSWTPPPAPNNRFGTVPMFQAIEAGSRGATAGWTAASRCRGSMRRVPELLKAKDSDQCLETATGPQHALTPRRCCST